MTYRDWYVARLYDLLEQGGSEEVVDRLVAEVNHPTATGFAALANFSDPIGPCGTCGEPFACPGPPPQLDQEVLCPNCAKQVANPS
jgi:hypothetical protein